MLNDIFSHILSLQQTACYVILLVLVLRFFLRKQPKIYSYALWSVVLFRLLCPFRFETVLSLLPRTRSNASVSLLQTTEAVPTVTVPQVTTASTATVPDTFELPTVPMEPAQALPTFDWQSLLPYLWLAGIGVLLIYSLYGLWKLKRSLRSAEPMEDNIYRVQNLETAFVLGIFRPNIYLPSGLTEEEREYILLHEQTHLRRGDHLIKIAAFTALCVHWFNPLVWLAFILCAQDMEMSCDEAVISKLGSGVKKAYSGSLLSLAAGKRLLRATPLAFGEGDTKVRIKNILNYKKPAFWVSVLLTAAVAVLGVALASDPVSKHSDISAEEATELMNFYFPSPYIVEADTQQNVVGDEEDDWLYTVYLDVNKATSAMETEVERRKMYVIALDSVTRDLWEEKDGAWTLYNDYIEVDYETLWKNRTEYIGDNTKVSQIAGNLPYPDYVTYEGISIQSSEEPYELTVRLCVDSKENLKKVDTKLIDEWDTILYSLIGNMRSRKIIIRTQGSAYTKTWDIVDAHVNSEDFAAAATLEGFRDAVTEQRANRAKSDAKATLAMANWMENMKRAAFYYMDWPQGSQCEKFGWGISEYASYSHQCKLTFSGIKAPQQGSKEEQLLRRNAAAIMNVFSGLIVEYQFDDGENLLYSTLDGIGITISEAEITAEAQQAEFLQSIVDGNIPQESEETEEIAFLPPFCEEDYLNISAQYEKDKHNGVDFVTEHGSDILAVADGVVKEANSSYTPGTGNGIYVIIEHNGGYESLYAHCSELLVSAGQQVKAGEVIAKVGSTGASTGPHLHFELSRDGEIVDPMEYLGQTNEPFLFPLPQDNHYQLVRAFDEANDWNEAESGVDFAVAAGTDVLAVRDGTVELIQTWRSKGKQILLSCGQGWLALYSHCDDILVEQGQKVKAGEVLAKVALSKDGSEPILTFELAQSRNKKVVDPMEYLVVLSSENDQPDSPGYAMAKQLTGEYRSNFGRALDDVIQNYRRGNAEIPSDFPPADQWPDVSPAAPAEGSYFAWSSWISEKPIAGDILHIYMSVDEEHALLLEGASLSTHSNGMVSVEFDNISLFTLPQQYSSLENYLATNYDGFSAGSSLE